MKRPYIFALLVTLLFILFACGEQAKNNIYGSPVDFKLYLNAWDSELKAPGVYKTYTSPDDTRGKYIGYGGLLVVSGLQMGSSSNTFPLYAYDLACPYEQRADIRVEVKDLDAVCPKCKSSFEIFNGTGVKNSGPTDSGLQRYPVASYNATSNIFRVVR